MPRPTVTAAVSQFISATRPESLPPVVLERARIHLLDTLGAIASGSTLKPGRLIAEYARAQGGEPTASVIANDFRTSPALAAMANGTMAHADETDDAHFSALIHPGAAVVPAAIAVGEARHANGLAVASAIVVGYDVMARLSKAIDGPHMKRRGFNGSALCGSFGAASAVANLLRLNEEECRYALTLAATQSSGMAIWRLDEEHVQKALSFSGFPARNGVTAATMAEAGFTAPRDVFDGQYNFLSTFSPSSNDQFLTDGLGARFEILGTSVKKYPAGQPLQATLDALFGIVTDHGIRAEDVVQVEVRLPESAADTVNARTMADINAQFLIAVALLDGRVDFAGAHAPERMEAPEVVELLRRIQLVADPELTKVWPAERKATVVIRTATGATHSRTSGNAPGSPENPMSGDDVAAKFLGLVEGVVGRDEAERAVASLESLEAVVDIGHTLRWLGSRSPG